MSADRQDPVRDISRTPTSEAAPSLDLMLCFALYSASASMTRLYRPLLEPIGLTYPQYLVMRVLWDGAPRSVGGLGTLLGLDSGTLTPLLKRLEAAGFVTRRRDPADERRVIIDLTEAGRALRAKGDAVAEALICQMNLPLEDISALNRLARRFSESVKAD